MQKQYVNVSSNSPLIGSTYIELPNELKHSKKGLINIKNNDNKCFLWCHIRHLNLVDNNPQRITKEDKEFISKLNYEKVDFSVSKKDYSKIEMLTKICINNQIKNLMVYGFIINIKNFVSHYVYIKDLNSFMFNKTKNKNKKCFCRNCLQCFSSEEILIEHIEDCQWQTKR